MSKYFTQAVCVLLCVLLAAIITDIGYVLGSFTTSTRDETTATFTAVFANVQYGVEYNYSINGVLNTSRSHVLEVVVGGHKKVVVQASPVVNGVVLHGYGSSRTLTTAALRKYFLSHLPCCPSVIKLSFLC